LARGQKDILKPERGVCVAWDENEAGYAHRLVEMAEQFA
jgi:glyceraldehyde-3-phosphate dehydrogenase/erythrose-4-phosphate dehydrogenase